MPAFARSRAARVLEFSGPRKFWSFEENPRNSRIFDFEKRVFEKSLRRFQESEGVFDFEKRDLKNFQEKV